MADASRPDAPGGEPGLVPKRRLQALADDLFAVSLTLLVRRM